MSFDMQSFCKGCGRHRQTMPFGQRSSFFDRGPCRQCGDTRSGFQTVAKRKLLGGWVTPDGTPVEQEMREELDQL